MVNKNAAITRIEAKICNQQTHANKKCSDHKQNDAGKNSKKIMQIAKRAANFPLTKKPRSAPDH